MNLIQEIDFGTPIRVAETKVTLTIDGETITVPKGTSVMAAAMGRGVKIPKLCASDNLEPFGSCRLCLVEIAGQARDAGLLHDAGRRGHGRPHPEREACAAAPRRDGALCFRLPARCPDLRRWRRELQDAAGEVGLREVRYGFEGENPSRRRQGRVQPLFRL